MTAESPLDFTLKMLNNKIAGQQHRRTAQERTVNNFYRKDLAFSLCGLNCGLCPMRLGGHCPGCGGGEGNQSCAIARCSLSHQQVEYCFLCEEFPCKRYEGAEEADSFITHRHQLKDIARAQAIGLAAYQKEQAWKAGILKKLLEHYNDGRKKTFYCLAVNLLPGEVLGDAVRKLEEAEASGSLTADQAAGFFDSAARDLGLLLKLRKK